MTQEKILSYAYIGAIESVKEAGRLYNKNPNEKTWEDQKKIWNDIKEIQELRENSAQP